ncbi:Clusterin-associated protein 1-like [Oopsacas minuta]|uniref:Clusterin-associated protein 1-like n=1 Tax=Oopsacas minuta TaxID=111878 RepID=A0AAV7K1M2_9METZ|nr:Clusterin-associated protein 1-like [Oopsacas minuta]
MSFREMRQFREMMTTLGYPHLVSMKSFRQPNFSLVAEMLKWLVLRYEPSAILPFDIDTEQDRLIFIKSVVQYLAERANIKLNPRRLYSADGYAVKELLKIASLLYKALRIKFDKDEVESEILQDFSLKLSDLKTCRQLANDITSKGAVLYDLLGQEMELRDHRKKALANAFDMSDIEQSVHEAIRASEEEISEMLSRLENAASDNSNLQGKIEKKQGELDRSEKRLKSLQSVRPAYMDEFERLESDMKQQYDMYVEKFRNMTYLEQQWEEWNRGEQDKLEESQNSLRQMQQQIRLEEQRRIQDIHTDDVLNDNSGGENLSDEDEEVGAMGIEIGEERRYLGAMNPQGLDSDESLTSSYDGEEDRDIGNGSRLSDAGGSSDDDF